jgi:hypothetical protein
MLSEPVYSPGSRFKNLIFFAFVAIVTVYLADCFTPFRIHMDGLRYFAIKDCIEFGCPLDSPAATDYFPYGYTALLLVFSKLGILKSFWLVLINCIFLFTGLYFFSRVFEKKISPYLLSLIILINWLFVKYTAHPLSEMQYIFFSLMGVYFFHRFIIQKRMQLLLLSLFFSWLAFVTKTVGITLMGAIAVGLIWEFREAQLAFLKKNKILVGSILVLLVLALIFFSKFLGINHYANVLSEHFKEAPFFTRMEWRFKEWGEMFLNTPSNKVIDHVAKLGEYGFVLVGFLIFCWFMFKLYFKKNNLPFFLKAYFLFYCIIIFNWPFNDPRFWIPVMPLMAAFVLQLPIGENKLTRFLSTSLFVVYLALGAFASGYMVYTSFNKAELAKNQAKGVYKNEYEVHFFGKPLSDTATQVDPYIVEFLRRYDK